MIDWLEEIWKEGEDDLPLTGRSGYVFRRAAVPADGEPSPAGETAGMAAVSRMEESPLGELYRRAGETLSVTIPARPARREIVVQEGEPSRPGLTARELDLAVRRDSRRYDGGMNPY